VTKGHISTFARPASPGSFRKGVLETNKQNFGLNQNKPKQDLFWLCFGLFRETKIKRFWFVSVCFRVRTNIKTTEINRTVLKKTETTLNFLKKLKYALFQTVWVGLLFVSVQSKQRNFLFLYRSETTETKCFETNRKKPKNRKNSTFSEKIPKYALYQIVSVGLLFVSIQSKHSKVPVSV
jgi:hypothetical protein